MKYLKLAWRNLWRNPRRSLISMASVFFGVITATIMTSMQYGSYDAMIDNVVKFYSGYAQIFTKDYDENKTINNCFISSDSLQSEIQDIPKVTHITPRLEYFALASSEEITKGAMIIGVSPENERKVTSLNKWLEQGTYLQPNDPGVLVAVNLATYLQIKPGDTLVLYGQGFHGVTAAGLFPVKGILKFPLPELNNNMIYMDINSCQQFFGAGNRVSSLVVMVADHYDLPSAMRNLKTVIPKPLIAKSWSEMQPELVSMIDADKAGGLFMKFILYMVVGFGIMGTIIMMMSERIRELGVTVAIGMQRTSLSWILFLETVFTGFFGALLGIFGSIPIISWFYNNPVELTGDAAKTMINMGIEPYLYFALHPFVFYNQALVVFILTLMIGIIPVYKVFKLKVYTALRA